MAERASGHDEARKTRVFISYSRQNKAFTDLLASKLIGRGYKIDYDTSSFDPDNIDTGISAEDDWWKRLQEMITACEAMVFVVSPESAASQVCDEEIAYARTLGKRVIPILLRPIDFSKAPPRLAALNVKLSFENERAFDASLAALATALDVDVAWHREGARLMALAAKWDAAGRSDALLLPSGAVIDAEAWAARRPAKAEPAGELFSAYLAASSAKAKADRERLHGSFGRAYIKPAEQALAGGRYDAALRLVAAGVLASEDLTLGLVPELRQCIHAAAGKSALVAVLRGHERGLNEAVFSLDGSRIVTAGSDDTARIWDCANGRQTAILRCESTVMSVAFSNDGFRVLTGVMDGPPSIWETATGRKLVGLRQDTGAAAFTHDELGVITHNAIWDIRTGRRLAKLHSGSGGASAWSVSPDRRRVFVSPRGDTAEVWDSENHRRIASFPISEASCAAFDANGARLIAAGEDAAIVWDVAAGQKLAELKPARGKTTAAAMHASGKFAAVAAMSADSYDAYVWEVDTGRLVSTVLGHRGLIRSIAFSPDGWRLLTASQDDTARLWDVPTGEEIAAFRGHQDAVWTAAFNVKQNRIVTASVDGTARIWDAANGCTRAVLAFGSAVYAAAFNADGSRLITGTDDAAEVWDTVHWTPVGSVRHRRRVIDAAFSPDPGRFLTVSEDGARIWEADGARRAGGIEHNNDVDVERAPFHSAAFGADASRLVVVVGGVAQLWDMRAAVKLADFAADEGSIHDAVISPDGALLAAGGDFGFVRVWQIPSGREVATMSWEAPLTSPALPDETPAPTPRAPRVTRIRFNPPGTLLLTEVEALGETHVWDIAGGRVVSKLPLTNACFGAAGDYILGETGAPNVERYMPRPHAACIFDAEGRHVLMELGESHMHFARLALSSDESQVAAPSHDKTLRVFDVRRLPGLKGDPVEILAACLANGCGQRTEIERSDLLMQSAPDDLFEALMARLTPEQRANVKRREAILRGPLSPECYSYSKVGRGWIRPAASVAAAPPATTSLKSAKPLKRRFGMILLVVVLTVAMVALFALDRMGAIGSAP